MGCYLNINTFKEGLEKKLINLAVALKNLSIMIINVIINHLLLKLHYNYVNIQLNKMPYCNSYFQCPTSVVYLLILLIKAFNILNYFYKLEQLDSFSKMVCVIFIVHL